MKRTIPLAIALFFFCAQARAEGTKELMPQASDFGYLQFDNAWSQFAQFNCPAVDRLNIRICNPGEKIYFGFGQVTDNAINRNDVSFRIKDPSGNIVYAQTVLTNAGTGFISTYNQAVSGPQQIVGAAGYNAYYLIPTLTGDYYIEFGGFGNNRRDISYFDITVQDTVNNITKNGRLWSKAWQLVTRSYTDAFRGNMYIYTTDSLVSKVDFNGILPYTMVVRANATGTANTGNPTNDRRSKTGDQSYGEYPIFLNDPDNFCFPSATKDTISVSLSGCENNFCINIFSSKKGWAQILIDLNGTPGYQPGTSDRLLSDSVNIGANCIPWDGKDGAGNMVSSGLNISIISAISTKAIHMPLYDVESHPNGFIISFIRPYTVTPILYWDDTGLTGGNSNLTGCVTPPGCHTWAGSQGSGRGDNNTINTWWFTPLSIDTFNVPIPPGPTLSAGNDTVICPGSSVTLTGTGTTITGYSWLTGGSLICSGCPSTVVTPSITTTYILKGTNGQCEVIDTVKVSISQIVSSVSYTPVKCFGENNGTATLTPLSGASPYTYSWLPGSYTTQSISNLSAQTYTVIVQDSQGCSNSTTVTITSPTLLSATTTLQNPGCNGSSSGTATAIPSGGSPGYTYNWSTSPPQTSATAINLTAQTYTVTVTDSQGCTTQASATLTAPPPSSTGITGYFCEGDSTMMLHATPGFDPYQWYDANGNPVSGSTSDSLLVFNPVTGQTYSVSYFDPGTGCIVNQALVLSPGTLPGFNPNLNWQANVFTPNGDGKNDRFNVYYTYIKDFTMEVYDRWGIKLFESSTYDINGGWDGKYNGKEAPNGVYYWIVTLSAKCTVDPTALTNHGFVHLLR